MCCAITKILLSIVFAAFCNATVLFFACIVSIIFFIFLKNLCFFRHKENLKRFLKKLGDKIHNYHAKKFHKKKFLTKVQPFNLTKIKPLPVYLPEKIQSLPKKRIPHRPLCLE